MRPSPFIIEIPDRPVYQPGSGPAMAPITLQPDDSDTGWVIAGTVDFQGISQYVVTPADNPAHRRPVKKQHILDWVSPKAHEDFEYAQYKRRIDEERERENQIMAKAAAVRKRIRGMGLARGRTRVRKPFARYMQLEHVEDSDRGNINGHLSSPEHSPDESNMEVLPVRVESIKRKRSGRVLQDEEPTVKRRGLSISSNPSLVWKPWKPSPVELSQQRQAEMTEDENEEDEVEAIPKFNSAGLKRPDTINRPILPSRRRFTTPPGASALQKPPISTYYAPTDFIPATASPLPAQPELHKSVLGPPIRVNVNIPKPTSLPPPKLSKPLASKPISSTPQIALNGFGESPKRERPKLKRHTVFPTDERTPAKEGSDARSNGNGSKPEHPEEKSSMGRSHFSDLAVSRGKQGSGNDKEPKHEKDKGLGSSSGSSNVLRWTNHRKSSKVSDEQSKYFASMKIKQKGKNDSEEESEETWEIHGILDDEMRHVNGHLVHHYLCEWVGDYDPTWEPEENISADALKRYEKKKKKKRDGLGFDGAADIETMSENGEALNANTLRRVNDIFEQEIETSDSEVFTDAAMFLTPDEDPHPRFETGSAAGEGAIVDAEISVNP